MERAILRGDIYYADLNPVVGSEQGGMDSLSSVDKEVFLGILAQYTMMKRSLNEQEKQKKSRSAKER